MLGDLDGRLKARFGRTPDCYVLLRPDRVVATPCGPQQFDVRIASFAGRIGFIKRQAIKIPQLAKAEALA